MKRKEVIKLLAASGMSMTILGGCVNSIESNIVYGPVPDTSTETGTGTGTEEETSEETSESSESLEKGSGLSEEDLQVVTDYGVEFEYDNEYDDPDSDKYMEYPSEPGETLEEPYGELEEELEEVTTDYGIEPVYQEDESEYWEPAITTAYGVDPIPEDD